MPRLSENPELVGFFSYSRDDDKAFHLSPLRLRIQDELRGQLGRTSKGLWLWQDQESIEPGSLWASSIQAAISQAVFFILIVSPRMINSEYCGTELQSFLDREKELGRKDLVFPILYIDGPD